MRSDRIEHPEEVGAEDVAVVGGNEADGGVEVDEVGHSCVGDEGNLGKAFGEADLDTVFQEGTADTLAAEVRVDSQGVQVVLAGIGFGLIVAVQGEEGWPVLPERSVSKLFVKLARVG